MPFSLGQLLRVAGDSGAAFLQGRDERQGREAQAEQQRLENEEARRRSTAELLRAMAAGQDRGPAPPRFGVTGDGRPTASGFSSEEDAQGFIGRNPIERRASPVDKPFRVTVNGLTAEFATEEEANAFRQRNSGTGPGNGGGGFSTADLLRDAIANTGTEGGLIGPSRPGELDPQGQQLLDDLKEENELKRQLRVENPTATPEELDQMLEALIARERGR